MTSVKAIWDFPANNGGVTYGLTDAARTYFQADRLRHVTREVVQNALDAHRSRIPKVQVEISDCTIPKTAFGGNELADHFTACLEEMDRVRGANAQRDIELLERGMKTLSHQNVRCLAVVDSGTRGLRPDNWRALVESEGIVQKDGGLSGGSFGIGKNAVFTISDIFTVIYSTRYLDSSRGRVEKCQGKARLMTHPHPRLNGSKKTPSLKDYLQNTGFYRSVAMEPLIGRHEIPAEFRLHRSKGAGIFVLGFNPHSDDWVTDVQRAVCENFFVAIHKRWLSVAISPSSGKSLLVDHETIDGILAASESSRGPYHYYRTIRDNQDTHATGLVRPLGKLNVSLDPSRGPSRTAYVNRKGMLITDRSDHKVNPISPRRRVTWADYAAVVTPQTDEGDLWIRSMESPAHDAIQFAQLAEPDQRQEARNVFKNVRSQLRAIIDSEMEARHSELTENLTELARYLPDKEGDGPPERHLVVTRVQARPPDAPMTNSGDVESVPSEDTPERSTSSGASGDGVRDGDQPRTFAGRILRSTPRVAVQNPRAIPVAANQLRISFTPRLEDRGPIDVTLHPRGYEATAEAAIPISEAQCLSSDVTTCTLLEGGGVRLTPDPGERISMLLTTGVPIEQMSAFDLWVRETQ